MVFDKIAAIGHFRIWDSDGQSTALNIPNDFEWHSDLDHSNIKHVWYSDYLKTDICT